MKKTLRVLALMAIVTILTISGVKASSSTLASDLYSKLAAYGMSTSDRVKVERYVVTNNVTDEQAATVLAKAEAAVEIMKEENVTDYKKLSAENKDKVENLFKQAASTVGATVVVENGVAYLQNSNGDKTPILDNNGKLSYTGNSINSVLAISSIAVIALAAIVVTRKLK